NRRGRARRYINLMLTMVLGGLWHGAGWTFIIWGALHGVFLVVNHLWRALTGAAEDPPRGARRIVSCGLTFAAVTAAWVFFRAPTAGAGASMLAGMVGLNGLQLPLQWQVKLHALTPLLAAGGVRFVDLGNRFTGTPEIAHIAALLAIVWLMPNTQEVMARFAPALAFRPGERPRFYEWRPSPAWALLLAILTIVPMLQLNRVSEFLYYQF